MNVRFQIKNRNVGYWPSDPIEKALWQHEKSHPPGGFFMANRVSAPLQQKAADGWLAPKEERAPASPAQQNPAEEVEGNDEPAELVLPQRSRMTGASCWLASWPNNLRPMNWFAQ